MKLKKLTAVLLVSSMALSLTACGGEKGSATAASASSSAGSGTTSSASSSSASSAKSGSAASNSAAGEADATVGTVDEDVDYAAGETYKFVYVRALPLKDFTVLVCDFANWAETAPLPCFILKK